MNKIESFTVDHERLLKGIYVSRRDIVDNIVLTTFDIRMKRPNLEPVMNTSEIHCIEHLGATFLRNHNVYGNKIIYFGPMGCRTGFYLIVAGEIKSREIFPLVKEMFEYIVEYEGPIPGASSKECGNYLDMNLNMAKYESRIFLETLNHIAEENLTYPQ